MTLRTRMTTACVVLVGLAAPPVAAQSNALEKIDAAVEALSPARTSLVDRAHARLSRSVVDTAARIDGFFGDERIDEEFTGSRVRVRAGVRVEERGGVSFAGGGSARLALPRLRNRFNILVGTEEDDEVDEEISTVEDFKEVIDAIGAADFNAALRYFIATGRKWNAHADAGMKIRTPPTLFTRLRVRRSHIRDPWELRLTESVWWFDGEGFGETTTIDIERRFGVRRLGRLTSEATWAESSEGVDLAHALEYRSELSARRAVSLRGEVFWHTRPHGQVDEYAVAVKFRQRLHDQWLFWELEPSAAFPHDRDYEFTPALTIRMEVVLGDF